MRGEIANFSIAAQVRQSSYSPDDRFAIKDKDMAVLL